MARVVSTVDEFQAWIRSELHIPEIIYFTGDMAQFRKTAGRQIKALAKIRRPTAAEAYRLDAIRGQLDLCDEARWHARHGNVHLTQKRGGSGWVYFARRTRNVKLNTTIRR